MNDVGQIPVLSRRVARLRADGMSAKQVRGRQLARPYHGLRRPEAVTLEQPGLRIADAIGLMTAECVLTGWASRWIQGQAFCDGELYGEQLPVTILCGPGSRLRTRPGIRVRERRLLPGEVIDLDGYAATTMARATYDDMLDAPNPLEALVAVEMATSTVIDQPHTALDNVRATFAAHVKTRGRRQARWALGQASTRSASPWEPRTRMLATDAVGTEDWEVNIPVFDLRENLLGVPDLRDPQTGFVIESDGADHRRVERHNDDNVRGDVFENHGMPIVRIGAAQHARAERPETMERIIGCRARAAVGGSRLWTTEKPSWWWDWEPGRRWD
ncbi:hypothetical protein [Solicola gregarius]|uniref:DUF559 domain-containing protein n=1 Tax=Solicola gregarius TaxID=2908642 RepID=A0AA46TFV7_9ACTN|nr:hypothetical protein [Solicola gregarius]UYM04584.1 hypothetical protein L0C25_18920 [Solicola gregarius]